MRVVDQVAFGPALAFFKIEVGAEVGELSAWDSTLTKPPRYRSGTLYPERRLMAGFLHNESIKDRPDFHWPDHTAYLSARP